MTQIVQDIRLLGGGSAAAEAPRGFVAATGEAMSGKALFRGFSSAQRYLSLYQFAVVNLGAFALLGAAHVQGWTATILHADDTGMSALIFLVFLCGLAVCGGKIWSVSADLDRVRRQDFERTSVAARYLTEVAGRDAGSRSILGSGLRMRIADRIAIVRQIANSLVLLGLIGTVLGFVIALSGVDPQAAGDINRIGGMVANLIRGMSVALYTTLVGAVLNLWLTVNYRILSSAAVNLATSVIGLGEANARIGSV